jgi:1-deoxy-D-xylulose-5-phosphate reductoisomerase
MNAANEVAVARFLAGQGAFTDIFATVERALAAAPAIAAPTLDDILAADAETRRQLAG